MFRKKQKLFAEDFNDLDILEKINIQYKEYLNKETPKKGQIGFPLDFNKLSNDLTYDQESLELYLYGDVKFTKNGNKRGLWLSRLECDVTVLKGILKEERNRNKTSKEDKEDKRIGRIALWVTLLVSIFFNILNYFKN